ncbi:metallophosphoesterase family protein [Imhoffiella purpurea]|uniref:Putative phosphohydrolase n=1 Tax=Imhoffiella purpurea TaxID=1249627 RepID=W9V1T5_9GAMM|nr:metallophosphoesterase [Imhoffiella purpurea]EXJ13438.1 Putative phosphohydrolase [Imhoffiella purpurea]
MMRIAHISDLHFGTHLPPLAETLCAEIRRMRPDLVALSGDLTQHARPREFAAAATFIRRLPDPVLVVPGNHDLPGWRPWRRFVHPWREWRRHISEDLESSVRGRDFIAIGVKTARRWGMHLDWSRGRINLDQLGRVVRLAGASEPDAVRILVAHHPFLLSDAVRKRGLVGRADEILDGLRSARIDLILGGHLHRSDAGTANGIVVAQAGTAISSRRKGEPNAYNRIQASSRQIRIEAMRWDGKRFAVAGSSSFQRSELGWAPAAHNLHSSPQFEPPSSNNGV